MMRTKTLDEDKQSSITAQCSGLMIKVFIIIITQLCSNNAYIICNESKQPPTPSLVSKRRLGEKYATFCSGLAERL